MQKIVILDGKTTNPGDLSWEPIESKGQVEFYDRTSDSDIIPRAKGAAIVLTNKTPLKRSTIESLEDLRLICVMATGYDNVDIEACREHGITVCNVRGYSTPAVVQHTFALILELLNQVGDHSSEVKNGAWHKSIDFSYWKKPIYELEGQTLGIIGYGNIGKAVGHVAKAFGMNLLISHTRPGDSAGFVSREELLSNSDIVSLHCPLKADNYHMMSKAEFQMMKSSAILINTARGGLVNHADLISALREGEIAGAGIDVLESEPPDASIELPDLSNLVVSPHQAWASHEARKRLINGLAQNISDFLAGDPKNVVS